MLKKFRIVYHLTNTYIVSKLAAWLDLKYTFLFIFSMLQKKMWNTQIPEHKSKHVHSSYKFSLFIILFTTTITHLSLYMF